MATGTARPKAQGQEITKTAIAVLNANSNVCPTKSHIIAVNKAIVITVGTNIPLTLSASFEIGAFELLASSIINRSLQHFLRFFQVLADGDALWAVLFALAAADAIGGSSGILPHGGAL